MTTLPLTQRAIIQVDDVGTFGQVYDRTLPIPKLGHVLIKVAAVALNPCDWKMSSAFPSKGAGCGSDFAGRVVQLGENITHLTVGDRVAGAVHANNPVNPKSGAYAQYATVDAKLLWTIPDDVAWGEAATIGLCGIGTVSMAAWHNLELLGTPEAPVDNAPFVLVYGGSSANGTIAIQLLRLSGYRVVTTCSPNNFELVESLGAEKAFDYKSPTCAQDIRSYTNDKLKYAMDIIAEAKTLKLCYAAIGRAGGRYVGFELIPDELASLRKTVRASWVLGIRMTGAEIALGKGYGHAADAELYDWGCDLSRRVGEWVREGKIKAHPQVVHQDGLDGIVGGIERLRRREVSGVKLVYVVDPST
ncbi:putative zinc-binding dehydrogenase family oxidoreductase [Xylariaceae sp. AK1471]|nr:putative zinc-binding dehydrogenase family oxidoreductase [Xylariaceae sp. AK1471]